jgi:biopolymer transport protein ExbB
MKPAPFGFFALRARAARRLRDFAMLGILSLLFLPLFAHPALADWWNGDWNYRVKIMVDASPKGANITQPAGDTQILVRLYAGNFNFDSASQDGSDIRFIAGDDKTPLHYHIEQFDGLVNQVGLVWVDVPNLAPGQAAPIYMYWGNQKATDGSDPHASYDGNQLLVYHFNEQTGIPTDATGYGNDAATGAKSDDGGLIGNGLRLDGTAPVVIKPSPSLDIVAGEPMTFSLWVNTGAQPASGVLFSDSDGTNGFSFGLNKGVAYAQITTATGTQVTSPGTAITGPGWHLITITAANALNVYVDAQAAGTLAAALPAINGQMVLGGVMPAPAAPAAVTPATPAPTKPAAKAPASPAVPAAATAAPPATPAIPNFVGLIDEFEISKTVRPVGDMQIAIASQGTKPDLLAFLQPQQASIFGSGYVGIIVKSVTPDAWVIIGILAIMAVLSWIVMVAKARYVGRLAKANRAFMQQYRHGLAGNGKAGDFNSLQGADAAALAHSSLFRLYQVGATELNDRLHGGLVEANGMLAPQSIAAIRAAIDYALVYERQRLNRLMVLLTISISGGPFLGLLGTVVGVMITFAAIAQAGDVNVNAIAPGISAALLATVAGLAVAIPALFGYNYFITRIREVNADMNAFIDDFVTRMGEGMRRNPAADAAHFNQTADAAQHQAGE